MKHTSQNGKGLKGFFLAFLIVALAFLAVGLGTLGSFYDAGDAYELMAKRESDNETPYVEFQLSNPTEKDGTTINVRVVEVYINVAVIYAEAGQPVTLRLERAPSSGTTFTKVADGVLENFYTPEPELDENGKPVATVTQPDATDVNFRYVAPFQITATNLRVTLYPYYRLSVSGGNANVLINEVVFKGEKIDTSSSVAGYPGLGEYLLIPATVRKATPYATESTESARERAEALLDAQRLPSQAESSFNRFSKAEIYTLMTLAEMRMGRYVSDGSGNVLDTYHIDGVYGALGNDILALGTLMFGMSPFGLRFFPMLAAFGALVVLSRLVARLTKSEKAGFVFSLIYVLSCMTLGYAHLGTPLFIGVFFFACALSFAHRFFANGIRKATFASAMPVLLAGLFGALAMCVNGAFAIPMLGVLALFVAGMVRQKTAKAYHLEKVLAEEDVPVEEPVESTEEGEAPVAETKEYRAGRVVAEYRFKNRAAVTLFAAGIIIGTFLFALIGMLPAYFTYLKAYDNPVDPSMNVFALAWKAFAGGFVGSNTYGGSASWLFETVFRGEGALHAATLIVINPVALALGVFGICFAVGRLIVLLRAKAHDKAWRAELRRIVILLAGLVLSVVTALVVKSAGTFILLSYLFSFMLAACFFGTKREGNAERVVGIVGTVLLAVCFLVLAVFLFSLPLPAAFLNAILG